MSKIIAADRNVSIWWNLTRTSTLTVFAPVLLGTIIALAIEQRTINWLLFCAMLIASILIQVATNILDEHFDHKRMLSPIINNGTISHGIAPKTIMQIALGFYSIAIILGLYISAMTSWLLIVIGLFCILTGYLYKGRLLPYTPFSELVSIGAISISITLIAFYLQTGTITLEVILLSIPNMFLVSAIMLANNLKDFANDQESDRKTLATLFGRQNAIYILSVFISFLIYGLLLLLLSRIFPIGH